MIRIEATAEVIPARGANRPSNQVCYAHLIGRDGKPLPYPQRVLYALWDGDAPVAVGQYTLAPGSVYADKYGGLALAPKLQPLPVSGRGGA